MRVVIVGLGATDRAIAHSLLRRCDVQVVGASDKDPRHIGQDLGSLLGNATANVTVVEHHESLPPADLAVVATTSDLNQVAQILVPLLERSYNVLSICEELAYPWKSHPELAGRLDRVAPCAGRNLARQRRQSGHRDGHPASPTHRAYPKG